MEVHAGPAEPEYPERGDSPLLTIRACHFQDRITGYPLQKATLHIRGDHLQSCQLGLCRGSDGGLGRRTC